MAIPKGWKKAIEAILKQDASLSDKLVKLRQCQEQFRVSDNILNKAMMDIFADFRTCDECGELLPDNTAYYGCKRSKKSEGVCRKCMGEASPQWSDDEREAFHEEMRKQYAEDGNPNEVMQVLDDNEKIFLYKHDISYSEVFDASGMMPRKYRPLMSKMGYFIACGVTECACGHRLRNKHGTCVQCNTAVIEFERRYRQDQFIYIAKSTSKHLVKVGIARNVTKRISMLSGYAKAYDWELLTAKKIRDAARVEYIIHRKLSQHAVAVDYWQGSTPHSSNEVFSCSVEVAMQAFNSILSGIRAENAGAVSFLVEVYGYESQSIPDDEKVLAEVNRLSQNVTDSLNAVEKEVLRKYFGIGGHKQEDVDKIAAGLGRTASYCMKVLVTAQRRMRHPAHACHFEDLLGPRAVNVIP